MMQENKKNETINLDNFVEITISSNVHQTLDCNNESDTCDWNNQLLGFYTASMQQPVQIFLS